MNDTMAVIYITQTGHVIGAVTCNSDPQRTLTPADVAGTNAVGDGIVLTASPMPVPLPVTSFLREFIVPASVLSVSPPLAYAEAVFQSPGSFAVSGGVTGQLSLPLPNTWKVTLHQTSLEIDFPLGANTSADIPVWAEIQDPNPTALPPDTRVLAGKITQGSASPLQLPLTILPAGAASAALQSGKPYSIVAMIAGFQPFFDQQQTS